ncbi:MAG TPA: NUDIX domain-containing protein [Candidatus Gallacutalibacter stercoravium]|nr:NUDIX domain-containing protein [Candidatus Gallacutalibacter stercoravium]
MAIRNAAKALLYENGKILLNSHKTENGRIYYDLPGGGQHQYETMEEAVVREVLEETGYTVEVVRFQCIAEEIWDDPTMQAQCPEYTHRVLHIFLVRRCDASKAEILESDFEQTGSIWVTPEEADQLDLVPRQLCGQMRKIIESETPLYLGSLKLHKRL